MINNNNTCYNKMIRCNYYIWFSLDRVVEEKKLTKYV